MPPIHDDEGAIIEVGSSIDGGNGVVGKVVELIEDDGYWRVAVEWPEWPGDPELFSAYQDWRGVVTCSDIAKVVS